MKSFGMRLAITGLTLLLLVSCGDGGLPDPWTSDLWLIDVEPMNTSVSAGATKQFAATGWYTDGSTKDLTSFAAWTSSNTSYATVDSKGLATGVAVGSCRITATLGGVSEYADLSVTTPAVSLVSIAITPGSVTIQETGAIQFTATGTYSDASTLNITSSATWTSSNPTIAIVGNTYGTRGVATAMVTGGPVTISAIYSGKTGTASLMVVPPLPAPLSFNFNDGLSPAELTGSGNANWSPDANDLSFKSGVITHSQKSCFSVVAAAASGVRFDLKVNSENNYDYLKLYVDSTFIHSWSGVVAWTSGVNYTQTAGTHEYKWCYEKDGSISSGLDAAWVDNISIY